MMSSTTNGGVMPGRNTGYNAFVSARVAGQDFVHVVKDPQANLGLMLVVGGIVSLGVSLVLSGSWGGILVVAMAYPVLLAARALMAGTIVSVANNSLECAGWHFLANGAADYVSPEFLHRKLFGRLRVPLTDILQAIPTETNTRYWSNENARWVFSTTYNLTLIGPFGAIRIQGGVEAKRDELFAVIRFACGMGIPIVTGLGK
jgi:hypothetical protein